MIRDAYKKKELLSMKLSGVEQSKQHNDNNDINREFNSASDYGHLTIKVTLAHSKKMYGAVKKNRMVVLVIWSPQYSGHFFAQSRGNHNSVQGTCQMIAGVKNHLSE